MRIAAVSCEEHERELEIVRGLACGASEGVFGPASLMWRGDREAAIFLDQEAKTRLSGRAQPDLATQALNRFRVGHRRLA